MLVNKRMYIYKLYMYTGSKFSLQDIRLHLMFIVPAFLANAVTKFTVSFSCATIRNVTVMALFCFQLPRVFHILLLLNLFLLDWSYIWVISGGSGGEAPPAHDPPYGPKFSRFHVVFWKIWQNHMLTPPKGWHPLLRGILDPPLVIERGFTDMALKSKVNIVWSAAPQNQQVRRWDEQRENIRPIYQIESMPMFLFLARYVHLSAHLIFQ